MDIFTPDDVQQPATYAGKPMDVLQPSRPSLGSMENLMHLGRHPRESESMTTSAFFHRPPVVRYPLMDAR